MKFSEICYNITVGCIRCFFERKRIMEQNTVKKQPKLIIRTMARSCKYQPVSFLNTEEVQENRKVYTPNENTSIIVRKTNWFDRLFK